jgi:hypothetical protein
MALLITHAKVSVITSIPAPTGIVTPTDWNSSHAFSGTLDIVNGGTGSSTVDGFNGLLIAPTILTAGSSYNSVTSDQRILVNINSSMSILLPSSTGKGGPVLVKDIRGAPNIEVTFSSGQLVDGLASVAITTPFGAYWFNPLVSGGWYLTVA